MEDKYKELLETHRSKFSLVVDVDRVLPILENAETLTSNDVDEINKQTSKQAKVDKVLDILIAKDNQAFKALCYALEPTYPHLLTVMFLGNGQRMNQETRSVSLTSDSEEDVLRSSQSSSGDARSQDLKATYTRIIPSYEYELHDAVSLDGSRGDSHHTGTKHKHHNSRYKHGMNGETRHNDHNRDYDWLKSQCERAMTELQALKMQQTDNTKRYEAVMKESDSYRQSYMSTLGQLQQSHEEINLIRSQNNDLIVDNKRMEQEVSNLRKLREEDKQEMAELRQHQREVVSKSGSTEVLTALDMYDRIKQEYDNLRERFSDVASQHSALVLKYESLQEESGQIKKQYQTVSSERDSAIVERNGLKQQCTAAIRNWDQVTRQRDEVMKEMNQALASQLRAKKELEVVQKDRDAALREYSLVMSERDQVHKEIEQLQEKLTNCAKRNDSLIKEKKSAMDEAETLKREITCALQDRDKAVKERNECSDKCNDILSKQSAIGEERDSYKKDYEMAVHERDIARKERQEALQDRDRILREKYEREQVQKEKADKMDQVNKETEHLRKNIEKLQQDLQDGMHEAEIAKNRRDWAMSERDKIVQERDSMRTLCDNLRRDRDRAVTDLAHALRDYDEMKKQKHEALKDLQELKEKYDSVNEKGSRKGQLNTVAHNHSRDSAIDTDLQEWESETIDVELAGFGKEDFGFDIVGGKGDPFFPNDNSLFISHVMKGGAADGKLQINDQLLRIDSTEVSNVDKRYAMKLLQNRSGAINMVVKRRKISPSRSWQALQISIPPGKDLGIHFDSGLFVTRITPGSYTAKEGLLCAGDRIISVNNRSVENMTPDDLLKLLYQCGGDTLVLDIWRQTSPLSSTGSSPILLGSPGIQDPIMCSSTNSKHDSRRWDSASESSKGSMKNIKTSGSQTDSLDSPGSSRRPKERKNKDNRDIDHKVRHSVHIFDRALETVDKILRQRHKSAERSEEERVVLSVSRPLTMIDSHEDVLKKFDFPQHQQDKSGSTAVNRSSGHSKVCDPVDPSEIGGTGTWPKCVKLSNTPLNGTYVHPPQKNTPKRPTLDGLINYQTESIPRVPPLPPERNNSSFVAARHTPQNSDSTITSYSSRPVSPISPQSSSITNTNTYYQKSPLPRHVSEPSSDHHSHGHSYGSSSNHRHKVNNTRNPPRMPAIPSQVSPSQFQLDPRPSNPGAGQRRPGQRPMPRDQKSANVNYLSPTSQNPPRSVDYGSMARSNNTTPEPLPGPRRFTDVPPGGRPYPIPNTMSHSPSSNSMPTPSPIVTSKKHDIYKATTSVHMPPFTPHVFPDSNPELEAPPLYKDWASSPSPSMDSRFTPTPSDMYSFSGSSPHGGRPDLEMMSILHKSLSSGLHSDRNNRIRIPSTPSVHNDPSGSVEVVSDRSSPCSPFPDFSKMIPSPLPSNQDTLTRMKRPHPGETRKINIVKTSNLVGFTIEMGPSGGIFVSSVNENSLAAQAGLVIGDQLLEICAINMRNATYDLAARVLQQCGNNLTMLVQYNPEKYNDNSGSSATSSANTSPLNSPDSKTGKRLVNGCNQPNSPNRLLSHSSSGKYDAVRKISFKKPNPNASLGIRLAGGNTTGIFVQDVEDSSPAAGINGIRCGDQILEYNGINFSHATAENAYHHLQQPCSAVRIKVRYHPSLYNKVRNKKAADSLYVRTMLDHVAEKDGELSFRKDDLLHIIDTFFNGQQGIWYAYLVNDIGEKQKEGTIPSKGRLEDDLLHRSVSDNSSLHDSDDFKMHSRRGSGSARRSFFRRSKKHQRNNSKDSRDFNSFSDVSLNSDSLAADDLSHSAYMPVDRLEYKKTRPVVLIAPLAEPLIQKLIAESPDKYINCKPIVMQTSLPMDKGLKDDVFIDYWQQDDHCLCIHVNSVTDICDKNIHCLLNVNPLAIERLHRLQIYPIVIFARHKSYKQLREVKDVQFLPEKLSMKTAKEQYEYCQKAEQDYRHLISATIQGGNLAEMTQQIKNVITTEQEKPIWVPSTSMMR